jgi:hypothetical protein
MSFGGNRHYQPRFWSRLKDWRYEMKSFNDIRFFFFYSLFYTSRAGPFFYPTTFCTTSSQIYNLPKIHSQDQRGEMDITQS